MQKWGKPEDVVAQRIYKDKIPGLLNKEVFLESNETGLVMHGESIVEEVGPGKHTLKDFTSIILVDISPKTLRKTVESLLTSDDSTVSCELEVRFDIYLAEKLSRGLLSTRSILTIDDVYSEIYSQLISRVLSPVIREVKISDLYGNRKIVDDVQISFETELKKLLELWGIELVALSIVWKFPEDYKQYLKKSGMARLEDREKEVEHKEKIREAVREKELQKIRPKGESKEETKSKLEKEAIKTEVKLNLRKKETVAETEETSDALELKEILDKQKIAKKAKKKSLGLEETSESLKE